MSRLRLTYQGRYPIIQTYKNGLHFLEKGNDMANFEETRDNCTNIEAAMIAADAHEETREDVGGATWHDCECDDCRIVKVAEEHHEEYADGANGYDDDGYDPAAEMWADHIAEFYGEA